MVSPEPRSTSAASERGIRLETQVHSLSATSIANAWGTFRHLRFHDTRDGLIHSALLRGDVINDRMLVRIHSECLTGDVFGSRRCDCGEQLQAALAAIDRAGRGILIYLRGHEGRGIGLGNKLKAYALQEQGLDTLDANAALGLPIDARSYTAASDILRALNVAEVALLSNNPDKIFALRSAGIGCTAVPMPARRYPHNESYLQTKVVRMGHDGLLGPRLPGGQSTVSQSRS